MIQVKRELENDGSWNYLIFQPIFKFFFFQFFMSDVDKILKGLSKERNTTLDASGNSFARKLTDDHNSKIAVKFEENYLK